MTTLLHLILPIGISLLGVWILLRTVKRQTQWSNRSLYANASPKIKKMPKMRAEKPIKQQTHYEDARLAKLGLGSLCASAQTHQASVQEGLNPLSESDPSALQSSVDTAPNLPPPSMIVLHIFSKTGSEFIGYELLQAILSYGFRFGEMDIFHRHQKANGHGKILFSLASAVEPGTFDVNTMGSYRTIGLTLFMHTDALKDALAVFDLMVNTAQSLSDDLSGVLMDSEHNVLTSETVADLRQRLHFISHNADQAELDFS